MVNTRGSYCVGYSFDQRPCTSSNPCGNRVDGGWSEWSEWSDCGGSCANAHRSRTRFCSNPRPSQGGKPCFGNDFELQPCVDDKCRLSVDGAWGSWSSWSECPSGCGFALQSRSRKCDSPPPAFGGKVCRGLAHQTSVCVSELCNGDSSGILELQNQWMVNGQRGTSGQLVLVTVDWVREPGGLNLVGHSTMVRACVSPSSSHGGVPCFGKSSEFEECQGEGSFCSRFIHYADLLDLRVLQVLQ
ncbi:thrombospondin type 1 domain protein [Ancylostoma caninum]|uniref:Thrombospondin type 1 domain protein n=1 Tax=Ancylostoma caninum TaxID=29170 RepID=A0A368GVI3_ANCCA|nr:thrombospondin type 1 domain protein [Ancylostoma caninum]